MKKLLLTLFFVLYLLPLNAQTLGTLMVSVETSKSTITNGRSYAPKNILAVWIEDNSGKFVKTLLINSQRYTTYLTSWKTATSVAGTTFNKVDAVTSATNYNYGVKTCEWDGTNFKGQVMTDGTYIVCMELTEANSTGNHSEFSFIKSKTVEILTPPNKPSFNYVTLKWNPSMIN